MTTLIPLTAAAAFLLFAVPHAWGPLKLKPAWVFPAAASLLFFAFSCTAIVREGPLGFWTEHTRNLWGNQIWFDLLLSTSVGWAFIVPQARALGMRPLPWLVLIVCTGSIGFMAMTARLLFLRDRAVSDAPG